MQAILVLLTSCSISLVYKITLSKFKLRTGDTDYKVMDNSPLGIVILNHIFQYQPIASYTDSPCSAVLNNNIIISYHDLYLDSFV